LPTLVLLAVLGCDPGCRGSALPASLNDEDFWRLVSEASEPDGSFTHSENLVSNETHFPEMIRALGPGGGVFVGVGPEQNYSYIAGLRPDLAFIVDIRRGNRNLHLFYKALFELSADRVELVSRLFSRERPPIGADAPVQDLFDALARATPSVSRFETNLREVRERLLRIHRFPLTGEDLESIAAISRTFLTAGPDIHYEQGNLRAPAYRELMTAADRWRRSRSYLASADDFEYVKTMHGRNLIVPIVGDFAGPLALESVGEYVRRHRAIVRVFYGSNVEVYLTREGAATFCANLASLPYGARSWFIGNKGMQRLQTKLSTCGPEQR
jgi:hypothetical protein